VDRSEAEQSRAQRTARMRSRHEKSVPRPFRAVKGSFDGHSCLTPACTTLRLQACAPGTAAPAKRHAGDVKTMHQRCASDAPQGVARRANNDARPAKPPMQRSVPQRTRRGSGVPRRRRALCKVLRRPFHPAPPCAIGALPAKDPCIRRPVSLCRSRAAAVHAQLVPLSDGDDETVHAWHASHADGH
jgi:hypothetical protein